MTDKEKIRTRIEELRKVTPFTTALTESKAENWVAGREFALVSIEVFLDSLPEKQVWHKADDNPGNRHPYPVFNPDTQEMAFAYYDKLYGWQFDRDYDPGENMFWLDIEKILPNKEDRV